MDEEGISGGFTERGEIVVWGGVLVRRWAEGGREAGSMGGGISLR